VPVLVSVIVSVRNGAQWIRKLTPALLAQSLPHDQFEVIIADDGSTDGGTDNLPASFKVTRGEPRTQFAAHNRGASIATGTYLAFTDVDCIPARDWLKEGVAALQEADLVAGAIRFLPPERRTVWSLVDIDTTKNQEAHVARGNAETANLFITRAMFDRLGGFEEVFTHHGDFDIAQRCTAIGGRLAFGEKALVLHPTRDAAKPFLQMVWKGHRSYAAREAREGRTPNGLRLREWVPIVQTLRARLRAGKGIGLDRRWLSANGVTPTALEQAKAVAVVYLVMPYLGGLAQIVGWNEGRRLAARGSQEPGAAQ
jgi:glycosyltransferase involved in cell wall biosynthesis